MCLSVITMSSWKIIYSGPLPIFQKVWHFDTELYEVFVYFGVINLYQMSCVCLVAQLCLTLCNLMDYSPPGSTVHGDSPGKNTGVGCHALLQGLFPAQGSNLGLPHCRRILYHWATWEAHGSSTYNQATARPIQLNHRIKKARHQYTGCPPRTRQFFTWWTWTVPPSPRSWAWGRRSKPLSHCRGQKEVW